MERLTFASTRRALDAGTTTCVRITQAYLDAIAAKRHLNAFLTVLAERSLERAESIDRKLASGRAGRLAGMVVGIKDALCMKQQRVTCGSKILERFVSLYDASAVARLEAEDAILIGKTNMDEFAMGSSTENSAFGPVVNPIDESRVPGGSSGGSAVAVAAGLAHTALGSDTGGSIRQPAAFCGIVGLKPTYGRVSRYGLVALSSSFDQIGPFALSVPDAAEVLRVMAGHDESDSTSARVPVPDYPALLRQGVKGLRVGMLVEALNEGVQEEVRASTERAADRLRDGGAELKMVELPHSRFNISAYYILMTAEASSNLARYDGARYGYRSPAGRDLHSVYVRSRSEGFGPEVKRRIMLGTYVLSAGYYDAYYRKAQQIRRLIQDDFIRAFTSVDCILLPTSPTTAFRRGEKIDDPLTMYLSDIFTVSANLAGIPGISIPFGNDAQGLPVGIQLLGRQFEEATIMNAAQFLEENA